MICPVGCSARPGGDAADWLSQGHGRTRGADARDLAGEDYSGVIYVFRAKRADRIKLLLWDGTGLVLVGKHKRWGKSSVDCDHAEAAAGTASGAAPNGSMLSSWHWRWRTWNRRSRRHTPQQL